MFIYNTGWTFLTIFPVLQNWEDLGDTKSVANFQQFYRCYFDKYFQIDSSEIKTQREAFVGEILKEALKNEAPAPTTACVDWMCDGGMVWKIWTVGSVDIWAYYTHLGNTIAAWDKCFKQRKEDFVNQKKNRNEELKYYKNTQSG